MKYLAGKYFLFAAIIIPIQRVVPITLGTTKFFQTSGAIKIPPNFFGG
jgi:hypothetical protein